MKYSAAVQSILMGGQARAARGEIGPCIFENAVALSKEEYRMKLIFLKSIYFSSFTLKSKSILQKEKMIDILFPQIALIKLSYIFLCEARKQQSLYKRTGENALYYCIIMSFCLSEFCLSVAQFFVRFYERTIKASDMRFAEKCRHQLAPEVFYFKF